MQVMRGELRRPFSRGFTLVELMIAMALVGGLTLLIYGLFVRTSESLTDVEGLSKALDQARFGAGHMRTDLQGVGSQLTSNADVDPWFISDPSENQRVHAIMGYSGWQNDRSIYDDVDVDDVDTDNPQSRFSGVVLLGAYNVPGNISVSFPQGDAGNALSHGNEMVVTSTESGIHRLLGYDPFDLEQHDGIDLTTHYGSDILSQVQNTYTDDDTAFGLDSSLFRVTDTDGFSQVTTIGSADIPAGTRNPTEQDSGAGMVIGPGHEMDLTLDGLYFSETDEPGGFDRHTEDDVMFDAAFIDAYWYHVQPSVDDPLNFQLIRQRLDASGLVDGSETSFDDDDLDGLSVGPPMVVAEYVVDFRVWFDCGSGDSFGEDWADGWNPVTDSSNCIDPNLNSSRPENANFAHLRISTRTESENSNRPHYTLVGGWEGFEEDVDGNTIEDQMRTYQVVPEAEGSAAVVTVQASVELTNFVMRNL